MFKKLICVLLSVMLIVSSSVVAFATAEDNPVIVTFYNQNNEILESPKAGDEIYATVRGLPDGATGYLATYNKKGILWDIAVVEKLTGATICTSENVAVADNMGEIKLFIFDNNLMPLCVPFTPETGNTSVDEDIITLTGVVVGNRYTDLTTTGSTYAAGQMPTIKFDVDITVNNQKYLADFPDFDGIFGVNGRVKLPLLIYQDAIDADELLGYAATVKLSKDAYDGYHLLSYEISDANAVKSYAFDLFSSYRSGMFEFYENASSSNKESITVSHNAQVIYNGIAAGEYNVAGLIMANMSNNGRITFIDSLSSVGYDIIKMEVAGTGIVNNISDNGRINFLNAVTIPMCNGGNMMISAVDFSDENSYVKITKNGKPFDYRELKYWDVVSIQKYDIETGVVFIEVLGEDNYVDGTVKSLKAATATEPTEYRLSDGNWYQMANGFYSANTLKVGTSGRFYIDNYGKLVAYRRLEAQNYGYITNAQAENGT